MCLVIPIMEQANSNTRNNNNNNSYNYSSNCQTAAYLVILVIRQSIPPAQPVSRAGGIMRIPAGHKSLRKEILTPGRKIKIVNIYILIIFWVAQSCIWYDEWMILNTNNLSNCLIDTKYTNIKLCCVSIHCINSIFCIRKIGVSWTIIG